MQHEDLHVPRSFEQLDSIVCLRLLLIKSNVADPIQLERAFHNLQY
jgi:hypothetical protein